MLGKLRPVGSRVPAVGKFGTSPYLWEPAYHTVFMASGTAALSAAVAVALARKPHIDNPEILIPAYGCPDLVAAILAQGGKPVLVDLKPGLPLLDDKQLQQSINRNTVAVVGVGFLGIPEQMNVLSDICRDNNVLLIEDSAQCFPPFCATRPLADCIVLSFGRGKPINLMGGGALLVRSEAVEQALEVVNRYPVHQVSPGVWWRLRRILFNLLMGRLPYYVLEKLPFLHIGETRFKPLDAVSRLEIPRGLLGAGIQQAGRRPLVQRLYHQQLAFSETMGWSLLGHRTEDHSAPMLRYALLAPTEAVRNRVSIALNRSGVGASTFYGCTLPNIAGLEALFSGTKCPHADDFASRLMTLPCHEDVRPSDVALTAGIIRELGHEKPVS